MSEELKAWLAIAGAVLTSGGMWIWRMVERRDQRQDKSGDWRARQDENLYARMRSELDGCYRRIRALEEDLARVELDRDNGWDLARGWYQQAVDTHWTAVTICRGTRDKNGDPVLVMPPLPHFRDLLPRGDRGAEGSPAPKAP